MLYHNNCEYIGYKMEDIPLADYLYPLFYDCKYSTRSVPIGCTEMAQNVHLSQLDKTFS